MKDFKRKFALTRKICRTSSISGIDGKEQIECLIRRNVSQIKSIFLKQTGRKSLNTFEDSVV